MSDFAQSGIDVKVDVTGTVNIGSEVSVTNFPTTQQVAGNVTATVAFPANMQMWQTGPVGMSASVTLPVWQAGPIGVTGSTALQVWQAGTVGMSGSVTVGAYATSATGSFVAPPSFTATLSLVTGSGIASTVLNANANRLGAIFQCDITNPGAFLLSLGATATTGSFVTRLPAGSYYELPFRYLGLISQISDIAGAGILHVTELT
jgi:hypothetical protein